MGFYFDEAERERPRREREQESNKITPAMKRNGITPEKLRRRQMSWVRAHLQTDSSPADPYVVRLFKDLHRRPSSEQAMWDKLVRYLITLEPAG
jgi:hypothetical protein